MMDVSKWSSERDEFFLGWGEIGMDLFRPKFCVYLSIKEVRKYEEGYKVQS
jgi:hypothetical protein